MYLEEYLEEFRLLNMIPILTNIYIYISPIAEVIPQVISFKVLFLTQGHPTKSVFYKVSQAHTYTHREVSKPIF